ncbi:hypothetical protein PVAP13_4NG124319 [Panicum virgatum]|uniref:Uncharacterized protein n=1 Tax=Panicum virgatum TaxID=38727 RepID=A0A8T0T1N6_PANVG|nr:hypothetical protein PVAP13_4NG124319 [Panicum virgatum]
MEAFDLLLIEAFQTKQGSVQTTTTVCISSCGAVAVGSRSGCMLSHHRT